MAYDTEDELIAQGAWVELETSYGVQVLRESEHFETDEVLWEAFGMETASPRVAQKILAEARAAYPQLGEEHFRVDEFTTLRRAMLMGEFLARAEADKD